MTKFEFLTQDVDTLAAGMFGIMEQIEDQTIEHIECATGITITRVNLAPEIRIAQIKEDLLQEYVPSQEADDATW